MANFDEIISKAKADSEARLKAEREAKASSTASRNAQRQIAKESLDEHVRPTLLEAQRAMRLQKMAASIDDAGPHPEPHVTFRIEPASPNPAIKSKTPYLRVATKTGEFFDVVLANVPEHRKSNVANTWPAGLVKEKVAEAVTVLVSFHFEISEKGRLT